MEAHEFYSDSMLNAWEALPLQERKRITAETRQKVKEAKKDAVARRAISKDQKPNKYKAKGQLRNVGPDMGPITRSKARGRQDATDPPK